MSGLPRVKQIMYSNTTIANGVGIIAENDMSGVNFRVQETVLGVGFVIAAFGVLALVMFRNVALAQSSQNLTTNEWAQWRRRSRAAGYTLVFLGALNLAVVHFIMHTLSGTMTFCEGLFWRSLACMIVSVLGCYSVGVSLFIDLDIFQWICFPCLLHSTSTLLVFIGLTSLPSSEATALYATYPCWALLFTYCIVQEPMGAAAFAGTGGSFIGMLLIVQPFTGQQPAGTTTLYAARATGAALTIIGGMLAGMLAITIRRMGVRVHYLLLSAWMSLYGIVLSLAVPLIQGRGPLAVDGPLQTYAAHSPHFIICLGLFMLCSCVSLLCLNWALQLENAGSISMVRERGRAGQGEQKGEGERSCGGSEK
jgi:drug/metabolite transporter (DMT)-like permease